MAPVKVFGSAVFANAARVMACLEEVRVEYEVVEVDYMTKEHKGLKHLARNVGNNPGSYFFFTASLHMLRYPFSLFPRHQSFHSYR
jgi:hypothetical protein